MAEETKIGIKLEEETKPIKKMCEKLMDAVNHELDKGIENIDTKELGEAIDMIKDLYEAKEKLVKSCYYKSVIEAMEEHDFEDEEEIMEDGRRGYRGQPRDSRGRYMSRRGYESRMMPEMYDYSDMEHMRDMDRINYNRMGYSENGSRDVSKSGGNMTSGSNQGNYMGGNMSRSENARRGYEEAKSMNDNSAEGKKKAMESLENYMKELSEEMTQWIGKMDASEKALMKNKMSALMQRIQ